MPKSIRISCNKGRKGRQRVNPRCVGYDFYFFYFLFFQLAYLWDGYFVRDKRWVTMTKKKKVSNWKKTLMAMPVSERKKLMEFSYQELKRLDTHLPDASVTISKKSDTSADKKETSAEVRVGRPNKNADIKQKSDNSIVLNGIKIKLVNPDLDNDGEIGGEEKIEKNFNKSLVPIKEGSELGDAIKEQNKDIVADRLSSMDFASRIDKLEMSPMIALDTLIGMGVIPIECGKLNRVKMRKSVSIGGEGRREFVDLVVGKKEQDMKAGFGSKLGNFIGMGQKPEQPQP